MNRNQPYTGNNQPHHRLPKQCQITKTRFGHETQKRENNMIEAVFMRVLREAKKLLAKQPQKVFERDQRTDNSQNCFTMHSFLCPSFFFELSCDISGNYQVEYAFSSCPFHDEIRRLLQNYPLNTLAKPVALKPDFKTFYDNVLAFQDDKHTFLLKVE